MSNRANRRLDIDLTTLTNPVDGSRFDAGCAIVQVIGVFVGGVPAQSVGLELAVDDGPAFYPLMPGLKLQSPDGADKFSRVTVRGPQQVGVLTLMLTDDPIPLLSAGQGGDPALAKWLDVFYGPHVPLTSGANASTTALVRYGNPYANYLSLRNQAPGNVPAQGVRNGRPALICQPGGGGSGAALDFTFQWVKDRAGAGSMHPSEKHQVWHLEVEVGCDGLGGTDGIAAGVWFTPTGGVANSEGVPDNAVSPNAFFGVVRDGAGGWQVAARALTNGALSLQDNITSLWPDLSAPVRLHIALADADRRTGLDGTVSVYLNEQLARFYTNMAVFPVASGNGSPLYTTYRPTVFSKGANAQLLSFANIEQWTSKGQGVAQ